MHKRLGRPVLTRLLLLSEPSLLVPSPELSRSSRYTLPIHAVVSGGRRTTKLSLSPVCVRRGAELTFALVRARAALRREEGDCN